MKKKYENHFSGQKEINYFKHKKTGVVTYFMPLQLTKVTICLPLDATANKTFKLGSFHEFTFFLNEKEFRKEIEYMINQFHVFDYCEINCSNYSDASILNSLIELNITEDNKLASFIDKLNLAKTNPELFKCFSISGQYSLFCTDEKNLFYLSVSRKENKKNTVSISFSGYNIINKKNFIFYFNSFSELYKNNLIDFIEFASYIVNFELVANNYLNHEIIKNKEPEPKPEIQVIKGIIKSPQKRKKEKNSINPSQKTLF